MNQALATVAVTATVIAILLGVLMFRDRATVREADQLRTVAEMETVAAIKARDVATQALRSQMRDNESCRSKIADSERQCVEVERESCADLLRAEVARCQLSVDPGDLEAVVSALRGRRR